MYDASWGNVLSDYGNQCGCTSIWDRLKKATTMLAYASEDPALRNPVSHIVLAL